MGKGMNRLTEAKIKRLNKKGRYRDGRGLTLRVQSKTSKSWYYIYSRKGIRDEIPLGTAVDLSLDDARLKAQKVRIGLTEGRDPRQVLRGEKIITFGEVAEHVINIKKVNWKRKEKEERIWRKALFEQCKTLTEMNIAHIKTTDVVDVVRPVIENTPDMGVRLHKRMATVFKHAIYREWYKGQNPAQWKGHLDQFLVIRKKTGENHHTALPYKDVYEFLNRLRAQEGVGVNALILTILTASREHVVPLSAEVLDLLLKMKAVSASPFLFPGSGKTDTIRDQTVRIVIKRMNLERKATVHGFRSTFRDWAGDLTTCSQEVSEYALAHVVGNATRRAYRRGTAFIKRRALMQEWANFCHKPYEHKVIDLH